MSILYSLIVFDFSLSFSFVLHFLGSSNSSTVFSLIIFSSFSVCHLLVGPLSKIFQDSKMESVDWEALIFTSMNVGESPKHARTSFAHMNAESIYSNQNSCNQTCEAACLMKLQRKWFLRASIYFGIRYLFLSWIALICLQNWFEPD